MLTLTSLTLTLSAITTLLFPVSSVDAASDYDDVIQTVDELTIRNNSGSWESTYTFDDLMDLFSSCNSTHHANYRIISKLPSFAQTITQYETTSGNKAVVLTYIADRTEVGPLYFDGPMFPALYFPNDALGNVSQFVFYHSDIEDAATCGDNSDNLSSLAADSWYGWYLYINSFPIDYPIGYEGIIVDDGSSIDNDGDGLTLFQEIQQGSSDSKIDTDGDGIDDLKESIWFEDRDEVFCDTSATPYACAYPDPLVKDIYIEIDWMENSSRSFQPNSTQIDGVVTGLGDYGYNIHIDTGEYGGGNALPYITDLPFMPDSTEIDYFDLKDGDVSTSTPANFNPKRKGVWRYVISGYNFSEYPNNIGGALPGSDNIFVSFGLIQDSAPILGYSDFDTAIAGTIVHETGHSLCLSKELAYSFQSTACQFSGIDQYDPSLTYDGVMNYSLMVFVTHLSYGNNGSGDHDDWGAINDGGIADFSQWTISDIIMPGIEIEGIRPGLSLEQAIEAQKSGSFGRIKRGSEIYDYRQRTVHNTKTGETRTLRSPL